MCFKSTVLHSSEVTLREQKHVCFVKHRQHKCTAQFNSPLINLLNTRKSKYLCFTFLELFLIFQVELVPPWGFCFKNTSGDFSDGPPHLLSIAHSLAGHKRYALVRTEHKIHRADADQILSFNNQPLQMTRNKLENTLFITDGPYDLHVLRAKYLAPRKYA